MTVYVCVWVSGCLCGCVVQGVGVVLARGCVGVFFFLKMFPACVFFFFFLIIFFEKIFQKFKKIEKVKKFLKKKAFKNPWRSFNFLVLSF